MIYMAIALVVSIIVNLVTLIVARQLKQDLQEEKRIADMFIRQLRGNIPASYEWIIERNKYLEGNAKRD